MENRKTVFCRGHVAHALPAAGIFPPFADSVISAGNDEPFPVYDALCKLITGTFINFRDRCAGNIHLRGALFMGFLFQVNQTDHFIFIQCKCDRVIGLAVFRIK